MARYIDADKLKDDIAVLFERNDQLIDEWLANCVDDVIDEQPTADVTERKIGKWEEKIVQDENPWFRRRFYCSVCGDWNTYGKSDFCPNCGAQMDEEEPTMEEYMYGQEGSEEDGSL